MATPFFALRILLRIGLSLNCTVSLRTQTNTQTNEPKLHSLSAKRQLEIDPITCT